MRGTEIKHQMAEALATWNAAAPAATLVNTRSVECADDRNVVSD
jgi:hypothetical protein